MRVKFEYEDAPDKVTVELVRDDGDMICWDELADRFKYFLDGCGFIVTERKLAEYFEKKANEMGNLKAND